MVRVDIENDVGILPSFIAGEHTLFNAIGTVDASVDFSSLPTDAVKINGQSVDDHASPARVRQGDRRSGPQPRGLPRPRDRGPRR